MQDSLLKKAFELQGLTLTDEKELTPLEKAYKIMQVEPDLPKPKSPLYDQTIETRIPKARVSEEDQSDKMPSGFFDATAEGFGSMGLFITPDVPFRELEGAKRKAGRVVGGVAGMVGVHVALNYLTGGSATMTALTLKGGSKADDVLRGAAALWKAGDKAGALRDAGLGYQYGSRFFPKLVNSKSLDKFFLQAADDPSKAVNMLIGKRAVKEAGIFVGYGQISAGAKQYNEGEELTILNNMKSIPLDALGGLAYAAGGAKSFKAATTFGKYGSRALGGFGAGVFSSGLNSAQATPYERIANGTVMSMFSMFGAGAELKSTRNTMGNILREFTDASEGQINVFTKFAEKKALDGLKAVPKMFDGLDLTSKNGFTAKIRKVDYDEKTDKVKFFYDVFNTKGNQTNKKGKLVEKSYDDFFKTYNALPEDVIRINSCLLYTSPSPRD